MPVSPSPAGTAAVVATRAPLADVAAGGLTAAGWNDEAAVLLTELTATQHEVAALLSGQAAAEQELTSMKESCSCELAELQEESWRLQMFAELEKMKGLISQLRPIEDDGNDSCGSPKGASKIAGAAAARKGDKPSAAPGQLSVASPSGGFQMRKSPSPAAARMRDSAPGGGKQAVGREGNVVTGNKGEQEDETARKAALAEIDGELAVLTAAIAAARDEVDGLMARKGDLTEEIAGVYRGELESDDHDEVVEEGDEKEAQQAAEAGEGADE